MPLPTGHTGLCTVDTSSAMSNLELLRTLVAECLSVAAEEIFRIVERTIVERVEVEEEASPSKWVVGAGHHRLLDAEEFPRTGL